LDFERERLMADGDLRRRRISQRLIKLKEARSESKASRMIKLKKEWRALLDRQRARVEADSKIIDAEFKALAEEAKARSAQAPPPPCDPLSAAPPPLPPCDPLSAAPPPPPPCDPFPPLSAPPPRARLAGKKTKKKFLKWKVPQERIDHMILNLRDPLNDRYPLERLRKRDHRFRELFAERRALGQKKFEYMQAIIKQFRKKGYAEDYSETETEDNGEEVEVVDYEENKTGSKGL
jgi:hypothetical protein